MAPLETRQYTPNCHQGIPTIVNNLHTCGFRTASRPRRSVPLGVRFHPLAASLNCWDDSQPRPKTPGITVLQINASRHFIRGLASRASFLNLGYLPGHGCQWLKDRHPWWIIWPPQRYYADVCRKHSQLSLNDRILVLNKKSNHEEHPPFPIGGCGTFCELLTTLSRMSNPRLHHL